MTTQNAACDPDRIIAFLEGRLTDDQLIELEAHLGSCSRCDAELTRCTAEPSFWDDARGFLSSTDAARAGSQIDTEDQYDLPDASGYQLGFLDPTDFPDKLGRFAGYEICGIVGRGGMGIVMKGLDVALDRYVAIKVLNDNYAGQSAARQRFAREAQAAAAVLHDNVIAIYGVDQWNGIPFLVMPYIKGESLQQRIDRAAPLSLEDVLEISLQIARGLAAAHDQGLVHRDIKPANILIPESVSRVIITDFGLARTADDANLTRSGVLAGTPQYMSPEQAKSLTLDGRADLFSLGSVMYAMVCGRPPFRSDTPYGILRKITDQPHRPLTSIRERTPPWFEKIVDRLLEKDPDDRFQSARELAAHLEDCLAHLRQPTTKVLPKLNTGRKHVRRRSIRAAAFLLTCILAVVVPLVILPAYRAGIGSADPTNPSVSFPDPVPAHLEWEFDDSSLDRLETDLRILLRETAIDPPENTPPTLE